MKTCENLACRAIHPDDFYGQCPHCGRPMGTVGSTTPTTLMGDIGRAARESIAAEQQIKSHHHGDVRVPDHLLDTARRFVIQTKPLPDDAA